MRTKEKHSQKVTGQAKTTISRRKFLRAGAATAAAAAAACSPSAVPQEARALTVTSPQVSRAETVPLKMQGTWGSRDTYSAALPRVLGPGWRAGSHEPFDHAAGFAGRLCGWGWARHRSRGRVRLRAREFQIRGNVEL